MYFPSSFPFPDGLFQSKFQMNCFVQKHFCVYLERYSLVKKPSSHRKKKKQRRVILFYAKCPVSVLFPLKFHWQVLQLICLLEWGSKWGPCLLIDNSFSPSAISLSKPPKCLWPLAFPNFWGFFWLHHLADVYFVPLFLCRLLVW